MRQQVLIKFFPTSGSSAGSIPAGHSPEAATAGDSSRGGSGGSSGGGSGSGTGSGGDGGRHDSKALVRHWQGRRLWWWWRWWW